jgi:hypothetical protein
VTDGGQGLATANNGKYVGVLEGTKEADRIRETRVEKLFNAKIQELNFENKDQVSEFLRNKTEYEIRELFDSLKTKYSRDIFGQGYLFRIVQSDEVANLESLTDEEKQNGIKNSKSFVPYDKGDKDGNRWYLKTPYYIDWSYENVQWMKKNSGKKGEGMPVVRNPQFYFREGFCWGNILNPSARLIKCKLKQISVNDVGSMSLYSISDRVTEKFLVCIINSNILFDYYRTFINQSVNIQINDIRQLPIIVPTDQQLVQFENLFDRAYQIKIDQFEGNIIETVALIKLDEIQKELDEMVERLYQS